MKTGIYHQFRVDQWEIYVQCSLSRAKIQNLIFQYPLEIKLLNQRQQF